jgi:hypothetical protein
MSDVAAKNERPLSPHARGAGRFFGITLLALGGTLTVIWLVFLSWTLGWLMNFW